MKKIKRYFKKSIITIKREFLETKQMIKTFKNRDRENYPQAKSQFVDIIKIFFIFPIMALPGSIAILTILELIAKIFRVTIFPKKQKFKKD